MKRTLATALAILVAATPLTPVVARAQDVPVSVALLPTVDCVVAGTNPQIEAGISPREQVQSGRVFFKSALGDAYYYVPMTPSAAGYAGVLPKPQAGAGPISYYVEGMTTTYAQGQSPEHFATVVEQAEGCKDKVAAAIVPVTAVQVFATTGLTVLPAGFVGVSSVVVGAAGTAAAGAAAAGAAAAGVGFLGGTAGIVAVAGTIVGITALVASNSSNPPASPSR